MAPPSLSDTLTLANGLVAPRLGFGVYESPPGVCAQSCLAALACGYRRFDTAQLYYNEGDVGQAVRQSGLARQDVFLATKIFHAAGSVDASYHKCLASIAQLDPDHGYVDAFLVHTASGGREQRLEMWRALQRLYAEGRAKSIGVSNFGIRQIEELKEAGGSVWPPHVNQIELHPWLQQREVVTYCEQQGIAVEAYCPLVRNQKVDDATLTAVARKHAVSPSRVLVRYSLQKGWVPLPKSDTPARIEENARVFDFSLDDDDMARLDGLDQGAGSALVHVVDNDWAASSPAACPSDV